MECCLPDDTRYACGIDICHDDERAQEDQQQRVIDGVEQLLEELVDVVDLVFVADWLGIFLGVVACIAINRQGEPDWSASDMVSHDETNNHDDGRDANETGDADDVYENHDDHGDE